MGLNGLAPHQSLQKGVRCQEDRVIWRIHTRMMFKQPIENSRNAATMGKSSTTWLLTWAPMRHSNTPIAPTPCSSLRKGRKRVKKASGQPISLRMRRMTWMMIRMRLRTAQKGPAAVLGTVEPLFRRSELPNPVLSGKHALDVFAIDKFLVSKSVVRTSRNIGGRFE